MTRSGSAPSLRLLRRSGLAVVALALGLSFAQTSPDLVAQPIDPVLDGEIRLTVDGPTSATLRVDTLVDLACVVVFGPDDGFGRLALDQDMGGGAHRDHFVLLSGLEPDTDYVFRLQGSAPDGTFYASEIFSFRTPEASAAPDLGENVALAARGARVTAVSSGFGDSDLEGRWGGANAIDGDASSEWSSAGDGNDASITVELSERVAVTGFGLWTRTMGDSAQIESFEVVNEEGAVWGPFEVPGAGSMHRFAAEGAGRTFTFRVVGSSGGNTGAVELAVYTRPGE